MPTTSVRNRTDLKDPALDNQLMSSLSRNTSEHDGDERAISSLCFRTGAPRHDVQTLFADELARLTPGATVRSYLRLRAAANVYATLRRRGKPQRSEAAAQTLAPTTANDPSR
jgi:hypothetical protein